MAKRNHRGSRVASTALTSVKIADTPFFSSSPTDLIQCDDEVIRVVAAVKLRSLMTPDNLHLAKMEPLDHPRVGYSPYSQGRDLFPPSLYPESVLHEYVACSIRQAFQPVAGKVSPAAIPYILGGISATQLVEVSAKVLNKLLGHNAPRIKQTPGKLLIALGSRGFGPDAPHTYVNYLNADPKQFNKKRGETPKEYYERLRNWVKPAYVQANSAALVQDMLTTTAGSHAVTYKRDGCFGALLSYRVSCYQSAAIRSALLLLNPLNPELGIHAQAEMDWELPDVTAEMFQEAVNLVYRENWGKLDLVGDPATDLVKVIARQLVHHMEHDPARSAHAAGLIDPPLLLAMSILSAVPLTCLVSFAIEELKRTGRSFLTADSLAELIELFDEFTFQDFGHIPSLADIGADLDGSMLGDLHTEMQRIEDQAYTASRSRFNYKVKVGKTPLFSVASANVYYMESPGDSEGEGAKYKERFDNRVFGLHWL